MPPVDYSLNTTNITPQESAAILREHLGKSGLVILIGPQGGGKTTISIEMLCENVGSIFEGRVRSSQPVILVARELREKMKETIVERRQLPIYDADGPVIVDVSMYDRLKYFIENIFDVYELGEEELITRIMELLSLIDIKPDVIEVFAEKDVLWKRRISRQEDARRRLGGLLEKEKRFGIDSNILGIQGARVAEIISREGVALYTKRQISRTTDDFKRVIKTAGMSFEECIAKILEISKNEKLESGFLVLHEKNRSDENGRILSDIVVGDRNSLIGVTLLEIYVGYRQLREGERIYKPDIEGTIELIHAHLQGDGNLSSSDTGASVRFGLIVSVVEPDGGADSTDQERKKMLGNIIKKSIIEKSKLFSDIQGVLKS